MPRLLLVFTFILALCSVSGNLNAQDLSKYVAAGDKEFEAGYPKSALEYYKLALKKDTHYMPANMRAADAYRALRNYQRSAAHYKAVIDVDSEEEFVEANLYRGMMLMQMSRYSQAERALTYFLKAYRQRNDTYKYARDLLNSCEWAQKHIADTSQFEVLTLDSGLNSVHAEMSPFMLNDSTVYFSTMRYEKEIVRKSKPAFITTQKAVKKEDYWEIAPLDLPIEDEKNHVGNGTFNDSLDVFYYSKCESRDECKIYETRFENGRWSTPTALPDPVNLENSSSTQPTWVSDGERNYLVFASNRDMGKGGMDLWYVENKNENWLKARNLGTRINTPGDEITPWFDNADTTLYFSSNRRTGFGGFDVFRTKGSITSMNLVENLGPKVNTAADDYYFQFKQADSTGYISSNRKGGLKLDNNETCCNDIYRVKRLPDPKPIVEDTIIEEPLLADTIEQVSDSGLVALIPEDSTLPSIAVPVTMNALKNVLPIKMFYHNDRPNPRTTSRSSNITYEDAFKEFISLKGEYLNAIQQSSLSPAEKEAYQAKMTDFFDTELRTSMEHLRAALDVLYKELSNGKEIELVIKGYASTIANSDYNLNLTYRRIDAIINYFEQYDNGKLQPFITSGSLVLTALPYGESQASSTEQELLKDKLGAVYGSKAAHERRIEIQSIEQKVE